MVKQRHGVTDFLDILDSDNAALVDLDPHILIVLNERGEFRKINKAFTEALNLSFSDVLGKDIFTVMHEGDFSKFIHSFEIEADRPVVRLLKRGGGSVNVKLVRKRFRPTPKGYRSLLILEQVV